MSEQIIIVGSGPSAVHCAQTLVESGKNVLMLDIGFKMNEQLQPPASETFTNYRKTDPEQWKTLLGPSFESLVFGKTKVGAQLTASRKHMIKGSSSITPLSSKNFVPYESLAYGGLGNGWGAGCYTFSDAELDKCGLEKSTMAKAYDVVSRRIGVADPGDGLRSLVSSNIAKFEDSVKLTPLFQKIKNKYDANPKKLNKLGFTLGNQPLALLSSSRNSRLAHKYRDMEFYCDQDKSVYRPWITLDELKTNPHFEYRDQILVTDFTESEESVKVNGVDLRSNSKIQIQGKKLVLAAGTLGTSRIALRSDNKLNTLPLLCNPYSYRPTIFPKFLGTAQPEFQSALAQLLLYFDPAGDKQEASVASAYGYHSLMLFRLLSESPINFAASRKIFQYLQSGLVIFGVHHPDEMGGVRKLSLTEQSDSPTKDALRVEFAPSRTQQLKADERDRLFGKAIRGLGCIPLKKINPGHGSSIHYGGTLPAGAKNTPGRIGPDQKLGGFNRVYIGDGSCLKYLPAKGVTLTLMAIGHKTAEQVIKDI